MRKKLEEEEHQLTAAEETTKIKVKTLKVSIFPSPGGAQTVVAAFGECDGI